MQLGRIFKIGLWGLMLIIIPLTAQMKKRVAVFTFEDKTDHSYAWWDGRPPGDGMADMLTTALVKSGKYTIIERQQIASLLQEQQLGQTGVVTEQSAAKIGKMLGVELAVVGSVTEFGYSQKNVGGSLKGFGLGFKNQKAVVAVDVRLINTTSGEILTAETVRKDESSGGFSVETPDGNFSNADQFDKSLVGKATRASIDEIVVLIDSKSQSLAWEGKVLKVSGNELSIKPGADGGVKVGDVFTVYSVGEDLIDPDTGLSLGSEEKKIGTIQVIQVLEKYSKAEVKMGTGFSVGDKVRVK
jgi:curli biogenesis system outer membrane secretion channel CsgG